MALSSARSSRVAVVMMDTQRPLLDDWARGGCSVKADHGQLSMSTLTYFLNAAYAQRHGYDMLFLQLVGEGCAHYMCGTGCHHEIYGPRHASYCKVVALSAALSAGYEWIVYFDSDAFISNGSLPLPELLQRYGASSNPTARAFFGWDWPYSLGPNMGFIALQRSVATNRLLRAWWNTDTGHLSMVHPFEQQPLQWSLMHMHQYRRKVHTLHLRTMDPDVQDRQTHVRHLDHNAGTKTRLWTTARAIVERHCAASKSCPSKGVHRLLATLRGSRTTIGNEERYKIIEAAARIACRDFRTMSAAKPPRRFNATQTAANSLRLAPPTVAGLTGAPLKLVNCTSPTSQRAGWQSWVLSNQTTFKDKIDPITHKERVSTDRFTYVHRFGLAAAPTLCLNLGVSRTPKTPFESFAQLAPCYPKGSTDPTAVLMRSRLHLNDEDGLIKTTHNLRDLRHLREQHTDCGFWSNCSRVWTVLPKPCWSQLETNPRSCGTSEPAVEYARRFFADRKKWPGYQSFLVGPSGPGPTPRILVPRSDRLCLRTWRGRLEEQAAVVFARCPLRKEADAEEERHVWNDAALFKWIVRRIPATPLMDQAVRASKASGVVQLSPRSAPHLCVAAPAMFSPWVKEGFGPSPYTQVQPASQNTAKGRHEAERKRREAKRKRRKLYQRKRLEASKHFRSSSREELEKKCKARSLDTTGSRDKLIKRLVIDAVKSFAVDD